MPLPEITADDLHTMLAAWRAEPQAILRGAQGSRAVIDAKQDLVICGLEIAAAVFRRTLAALSGAAVTSASIDSAA